MNTKTAILVFIISLCSSMAMAQQQERKPGPTISEWLKGLQQKISQIAPRKVVPLSTGVAGVRGAKEDSPMKLYWKGKTGEEAVSEEELREFREALGYLEKDDRAGAIHELEEFMKQFPDSALIPDAKKTLDLVKAEGKAAEPAK
ncbi:MAG: hypothetical protein A2010_12335 [Nitrospirae bacterium GWD2_57_9]|nr:MAG: hypothetical protein A2010_12335 [Nitrospirae bacterium GWD2_57_9]OGW45628.1 MAG: hypothetical protein A2078_04715 [Nitrospirae bacterium GWC2_57_9]